MGTSPTDIVERLHCYASMHGVELQNQLGFGFDGIVFSTNRQSAIKVFRHSALYHRERDVYLRLRGNTVKEILGFKVPQLVEWDDVLEVIEMTIVSPPFVLDFAGAYLDRRPPIRTKSSPSGKRKRRNSLAIDGRRSSC